MFVFSGFSHEFIKTQDFQSTDIIGFINYYYYYYYICVIGAPRAELQMRKVVNLGSELNVKIKRVNIGQKCNQL